MSKVELILFIFVCIVVVVSISLNVFLIPFVKIPVLIYLAFNKFSVVISFVLRFGKN
jgi:hypothetical protein